tara:strand:+ start:1244 stop:1462 length:219 start_codon:yes stop_codon:yes gene_type:complete
MCLICAELKNDKLTSHEARRNLGELFEDMDKEHVKEVLKLIWDKEDNEKDEEDIWEDENYFIDWEQYSYDSD